MAYDESQDENERRRRALLGEISEPKREAEPEGQPEPRHDVREPEPRVVVDTASGPSQSAAPTARAGISRDDALKRLQDAYQQHLGRAAASNEAVDVDRILQVHGADNFDAGLNEYIENNLKRRGVYDTNDGGNAQSQSQASVYSGGGNSGGGDARYAALVEQLLRNQEEDRKRALEQQQRTQQYLNQILEQASRPVSIDDEQFQPIVKAGRLGDQRNIERRRAALAERLAAQGLGDSGTMETGIQGIYQDVGESASQREAQLLANELQNRRAQLMQGLSMAMQSGNFQQAQALQQQLAAIDAQMRSYQFDANRSDRRYEFDNDLGYRLAALQAQLNAQPFGYFGGLF